MFPLFGLAYDEKTTHPALTQEIVNFFNSKFKDLRISEDTAEHIIQGSIDEDAGTRWLQHFYDPVHNRGLVLENELNQYRELATVIAGAQAEFQSSKLWAEDTRAQSGIQGLTAGLFTSYFGGENDYSWDRAVYEYTWGNEKRGLKSLGHILHLLEDSTVPDHTRNDPHPPYLDMGSPYEAWTKKFDRASLTIDIKEGPVMLSSLENYFDGLATYSNNNFFSKDTIFNKNYLLPTVAYYRTEKLSNGLSYSFAYSINNYRLFRADVEPSWRDLTRPNQSKFYLQDKDNLILSDYWALLSKQAVLHGAGVIKLFFDEVEKEKQTKTLYEKNRSWAGRQLDKVKNFIFGPAAIISELKETAEVSPPTGGETLKTTEVSLPSGRETSLTSPTDIKVSPPAGGETLKTALPTPQPKNTSPDLPIAGGGGGPDKTPPRAPDNIFDPQEDNQVFTSTTVTFRGRGEKGSIILNNFAPDKSVKVGNDELWSASIPGLPQGTTTVAFSAVDDAGNESTSKSRTVFVDSIAPSVSLTVSQCNQSLSSTDCLIATTTVTLEWSSSAADLGYYTIQCEIDGASCENLNLGRTTATTTSYTVPSDNKIYTFKAEAVDIYGNIGTRQTKTVEVVTRTIVINEIAWAGTSAARDQDEWIELYNPTSKTIDVSQMKLKSSTDNKPSINLSGTISAGGYYLIERTDDNTISDITASTTSSFGNGTGAGLINTGEVLAIEYKGANLDETPAISACSGWCGGSSDTYYTMERYDPSASGTGSSNWGSFQTFLANGKNADNVAINGTPGKRNSLNYLITKDGSSLAQSKTLKKATSPYIISGGYTISSGATLTVEPGVTIKFLTGQPSLTVTGILKAEGTSAEKIVFTAFKDDDYAGDTNQDSASTTPSAGDWASIKIAADGSIFDYAIVRYGGIEDGSGNHWANIRVETASSTIKNSIVEKSKTYGIWYKNASGGTFDGNTVKNNDRNVSGETPGTGLQITNSSPAISNNQFTGNTKGLVIESSSAPSVSGNTFTQNTTSPIEVNASHPTFSSNTASNNGTNGIFVQGAISQNYTLSSNLPFVIQATYSIPTANTLTIASGTIVKLSGSGNISASGKINAAGTSASKIVFTSLHDDDCGISGGCGDTNATTTTPAAGDWDNIIFNSGAASSTLQYVVVRYGGNDGNPLLNPPRGALRLISASIDIQNSTFEKNYIAGIFMQNSTSTVISNSTIRDHSDSTSETFYGLYLTATSTPTINNTTFSGNETNIFRDSTSSYTDGGGNTGL